MLLPRAAVSSVADRSFTRRTIVVGATLAFALGIGVGASSSDATDREVTDVAVPTIQIPSVSGTDVRTVAHDLARAELAAYAFDAYPAWRARAGDRDCPERLLDVNRMRPALHAVDPWGTPYQFLCGRPYGLTGIVVRTAGPDRAFDTTDDLSTQ